VEKSITMKNSQDPVWHATACFDVDAQSASAITFEVFDDDIGRDEFLGKAVIDISEIFLAKDFMNKWVPLESCASGQILVSARFIPTQNMGRPLGNISVNVHKARKIEKKNMLKKADPYVIVKLGKYGRKSQTVSNSQKPTWNFTAEFSVLEDSPRQLSLEVFDDDIGNDANVGNVTIEIDTIMKKKNTENIWTKLEDCKAGEVLISTIFTPAMNAESLAEISDPVRNTELDHSTMKDKNRERNLRKEEQSCIGEEHDGNEIKFIDPVYCDDEYVAVKKQANTWFMVVSPHHKLPINVNLVPFKQKCNAESPIFIYSLPRGGFHNVKRVIHSGKGLKKCGYEKPCVLRAGGSFEFWTAAQGSNICLGHLTPDTFGPDMSWVLCKEEYFKSQDYIEVTLTSEESESVFTGSISLYDRLNIDAA